MVWPWPLGHSVQAYMSALHRFWSIITHRLLAWPSPSLVSHLSAPNTYTFTRQDRCCTIYSTQHNMTRVQLAISINKHIWNMNSTKKAPKPLNSCVNHSFITRDDTPRHFSTWSFNPPWWMPWLTLKPNKKGLRSKIENSHSSAQNPSKSKHRYNKYKEWLWKLQVKKLSVHKKWQRLNTNEESRKRDKSSMQTHSHSKAFHQLSINHYNQTKILINLVSQFLYFTLLK